jgi:hypothetical protein
MIVEESRILQVSIFNAPQKNLSEWTFTSVLLDVTTIADEVDSQLKQAMLSCAEREPAWSRFHQHDSVVRTNITAALPLFCDGESGSGMLTIPRSALWKPQHQS